MIIATLTFGTSLDRDLAALDPANVRSSIDALESALLGAFGGYRTGGHEFGGYRHADGKTVREISRTYTVLIADTPDNREALHFIAANVARWLNQESALLTFSGPVDAIFVPASPPAA